MSGGVCCRCLSAQPELDVLERGRQIAVCPDCVRDGDDVYIETPAGDAVATIERRCPL